VFVISNKSLNRSKNDQEAGLGLWPTCLKWKPKAVQVVSHVHNMFNGSVTHGNGEVLKACLLAGFYIELTETLNKPVICRVEWLMIDRGADICGV
jgi:hypothetical protein